MSKSYLAKLIVFSGCVSVVGLFFNRNILAIFGISCMLIFSYLYFKGGKDDV